MSNFETIEKSLVKSLVQGDGLALQKLYKIYSPKLYRFIYGIIKNHDDTEDILQTVFIKLWDSRERLRTDTCFEAFLMTVARNTVYNFFKQRFNQRCLSEKIASQGDKIVPPSDELLIESELFGLLQRLVDGLPEKRKEIFILNRFKGYTYREIAEMQGISENTVDTQMRKALEYIRSGLSKDILSSFIFLFFLS